MFYHLLSMFLVDTPHLFWLDISPIAPPCHRPPYNGDRSIVSATRSASSIGTVCPPPSCAAARSGAEGWPLPGAMVE